MLVFSIPNLNKSKINDMFEVFKFVIESAVVRSFAGQSEISSLVHSNCSPIDYNCTF
jgi:hypothetical protein